MSPKRAAVRRGRQQPALKRVVVVVNKWWEANPVLEVLLNNRARPEEVLGWPSLPHHPCPEGDFSLEPRAIFSLTNVSVEIWCVSDLLAGLEGSSSSSENKMAVLPYIFGFPHEPADLAVAVGTAASYPPDQSINGSVIVGTQVFLHNGHPDGENPESNWQDGPFDEVLLSSLTQSDFTAITSLPEGTADLFLVPPLNPAPGGGQILASYDYVDLNTINVTNYEEYDVKDQETIDAYTEAGGNLNLSRSVETTHGLVRVAAGSTVPFLYVCGIVNRQGKFSEDVDPRTYAQDTSGSNNAGVVVAWMLPEIDTLLGS